MRRPWTWWLSWALAGAAFALAIGTMALDAGTHDTRDPQATGWSQVTLLLAFLAFAVVGALVAARQPRNAVGWLLVAAPVLGFAAAFSEEYAFQAYVADPGSLPARLLFAWLCTWTWFAAMAALVAVPLLYPDGRPPGRRWRLFAWAFVLVWSVVLVGVALHEGRVGPADPWWPRNPLGSGALRPLLRAAEPVAAALIFGSIAGVVASVVFRWRRSGGIERQQLKWMVLAVGVLLGQVVVTQALNVSSLVPSAVVDVTFGLAVGAYPVAIGIAMLRYRLYDVDVVIRKTLVYGAVTASLALVHVALVLAGQELFSTIAGGSNLAIAVSTLVVAALFLPLRARVQRVVDRRFYRHRYDAQRTLETFGARLREQVDLDELAAEMVGVVSDTMQPKAVSLWFREIA